MISKIRKFLFFVFCAFVSVSLLGWLTLGTDRLISLATEGKKIWDDIAPLIGILTSIWGAAQAYRAWETAQKGREEAAKIEAQWNAQIELVLIAPDGKERILPYHPSRGQLSRAELLGILGLYGGKERFDANLLIPLLEAGDLSAVTRGDADTLRIPSSAAFWLQVDTDVGLRQEAASPPQDK
jgi:hypothetical protein